MVTTLGMHLILARVLGIQSYGEFVQVLVWTITLGVPGLLGMENAALRLAAHYRAKERPLQLARFILQSLRWVALGGMIGGVLLASGAIVFRGSMSSTLFSTILMGACVIPLKNQLRINESILQGLGSTTLSLTSSWVVPVMTSLAVLILAFLPAGQVTPGAAMAVHLGSVAVVLVLMTLVLRKRTSREDATLPDKRLRQAWLAIGVPLMLMSTAMLVQTQGSTLLLGLFLGSEDVGHFYVVLRLATLLLFGSEAINLVLAPRFASYFAKNDFAHLQQAATTAAVISASFVVLGGIILVFAGKTILELFGEGVESSYPALLVLVAGYLLSSCCGSVGYLMTMTGNQRASLKVFIATGIVHVLLCVLLIPTLGIIGAALSHGLTVAVWNISLACYLKKYLGLTSYVKLPGLFHAPKESLDADPRPVVARRAA